MRIVGLKNPIGDPLNCLHRKLAATAIDPLPVKKYILHYNKSPLPFVKLYSNW